MSLGWGTETVVLGWGRGFGVSVCGVLGAVVGVVVRAVG